MGGSFYISISMEPLSRDFVKALAILEENFSTLTRVEAITLEEACKPGGIYLFSGVLKAKQIPSGDYWRWNQTKSRQSAQLKDNSQVSFYKLMPRRLPQCSKSQKPPLYKIWLFHINSSQTVLWCEQGKDKTISPPKSEPISLVFPRLEQLEFLKEFMPSSVSLELWPKKPDFVERK